MDQSELITTFNDNKQVILAAASIIITALLLHFLTSKSSKTTHCPIPAPQSSQFKPLTSPNDRKTIILATLSQKSKYPHGSPFVAKLDALLRHAKVDFQVKVVEYTQLPTSKIPVLHWNGEILSDSQLIIKRLVKEGVIADPDAWLTAEIKAHANMFRYGIENFIYFRMVLERWVHNWEATKSEYFEESMPWLVYKIVPDRFIQPGVADMLFKNGTSKYPEDAWVQMENEFWEDAAVLLGEKRYFFSNEKMCVADLAAFGHLTNVVEFSHLNPKLFAAVSRHENLLRFAKTVKKELYPEFS
ncbi:hypothetical protein BDR26DRAFT_866461 [Obelidium mucronatum]|nr:hypothetical protein BDR26DRAFT_866461 [Obelidium mucronatum]